MQVKGPSTGWTGLTNLYGAEWELNNQPSLPLDLHITADSGAEVCTAAHVYFLDLHVTVSGQMLAMLTVSRREPLHALLVGMLITCSMDNS